MYKGIALLSVLIMATSVAPKVEAQSEAALLFLLISPGGRAVGLGEAYTAISDDALGLYYNPAGITQVQNASLHVTRSRWLPRWGGMQYTYFGGVVNTRGWGTVGLSYTRMSYGKQEQVGPTAEALGEYESYDYAIGLSGAYQLSSLLSLGVSGKIIKSNGGPVSATAGAADIGVQLRNILPRLTFTGHDLLSGEKRRILRHRNAPGLTLGVSLQNMGPGVSYDGLDQKDPLPQNFRLGLAYNFFDTDALGILLTYDFEKLLVKRHPDGSYDPFYKALFTAWSEKPVTHHFGVECTLFYLISFRYGYYNDRYDRQTKESTWGLGIGTENARFDLGRYSSDTIKGAITIVF
ncbi:MAG: PorV/PorQ family protein [bacterium]